MKSSKWKNIKKAREILGLPEEVTRAEIQNAYREKCMEFHPDKTKGDYSFEMIDLNASYRTLMEYVDNYRIRLSRNDEGMSDEEWWMSRFGQDPIWTSGKEG
jgi:hypothetical protein